MFSVIKNKYVGAFERKSSQDFSNNIPASAYRVVKVRLL